VGTTGRTSRRSPNGQLWETLASEDAFLTSHGSIALYQGTTLVGPHRPKDDLGFSPWGTLFPRVSKTPLGAPCKSVPARAGRSQIENPITQTHLASSLPQNPFDSQQILLGIHPDRIERSMHHMDADSFLQQP
jgi:hypothetical protein